MPLQIMIGGIVFLPQVYRTARNLVYVPPWPDKSIIPQLHDGVFP